MNNSEAPLGLERLDPETCRRAQVESLTDMSHGRDAESESDADNSFQRIVSGGFIWQKRMMVSI